MTLQLRQLKQVINIIKKTEAALFVPPVNLDLLGARRHGGHGDSTRTKVTLWLQIAAYKCKQMACLFPIFPQVKHKRSMAEYEQHYGMRLFDYQVPDPARAPREEI